MFPCSKPQPSSYSKDLEIFPEFNQLTRPRRIHPNISPTPLQVSSKFFQDPYLTSPLYEGPKKFSSSHLSTFFQARTSTPFYRETPKIPHPCRRDPKIFPGLYSPVRNTSKYFPKTHSPFPLLKGHQLYTFKISTSSHPCGLDLKIFPTTLLEDLKILLS